MKELNADIITPCTNTSIRTTFLGDFFLKKSHARFARSWCLCGLSGLCVLVLYDRAASYMHAGNVLVGTVWKVGQHLQAGVRQHFPHLDQSGGQRCFGRVDRLGQRRKLPYRRKHRKNESSRERHGRVVQTGL